MYKAPKRRFRSRAHAFRADTCAALLLWLSLLHSAMVMNGDACGSHILALAASWGRVSLLWGETHGDAFLFTIFPTRWQVSTDAEVGMNRMITLALHEATILVRLAPGLGICSTFCILEPTRAGNRATRQHVNDADHLSKFGVRSYKAS